MTRAAATRSTTWPPSRAALLRAAFELAARLTAEDYEPVPVERLSPAALPGGRPVPVPRAGARRRRRAPAARCSRGSSPPRTHPLTPARAARTLTGTVPSGGVILVDDARRTRAPRAPSRPVAVIAWCSGRGAHARRGLRALRPEHTRPALDRHRLDVELEGGTRRLAEVANRRTSGARSHPPLGSAADPCCTASGWRSAAGCCSPSRVRRPAAASRDSLSLPPSASPSLLTWWRTPVCGSPSAAAHAPARPPSMSRQRHRWSSSAPWCRSLLVLAAAVLVTVGRLVASLADRNSVTPSRTATGTRRGPVLPDDPGPLGGRRPGSSRQPSRPAGGERSPRRSPPRLPPGRRARPAHRHLPVGGRYPGGERGQWRPAVPGAPYPGRAPGAVSRLRVGRWLHPPGRSSRPSPRPARSSARREGRPGPRRPRSTPARRRRTTSAGTRASPRVEPHRDPGGRSRWSPATSCSAWCCCSTPAVLAGVAAGLFYRYFADRGAGADGGGGRRRREGCAPVLGLAAGRGAGAGGAGRPRAPRLAGRGCGQRIRAARIGGTAARRRGGRGAAAGADHALLAAAWSSPSRP